MPSDAPASPSKAIPYKSILQYTTDVDDGTGQFSIADSDVGGADKVMKSVRFLSPLILSEHIINYPSQIEASDTSVLSTTSYTSSRRRRAASVEDETSEFLVPDLSIHTTFTLNEDMLDKNQLSVVEDKSIDASDVDLTDNNIQGGHL